MSRTIIETQEDALGHIVLKRYRTQKEIDEAWLRWFIYGDIEERKPCNMYKTFSEGNAYQKKFPTKFLSSYVEHLVWCDPCHALYTENHISEDTKNSLKADSKMEET